MKQTSRTNRSVQEITALSQMLLNERALMAQTQARSAQLYNALSAALAELDRPFWKGGRLTWFNRRAAQRKVLIASGLFDAAWYLSVNDDVDRAGTDPLAHFLTHGRGEGRAPNPWCT